MNNMSVKKLTQQANGRAQFDALAGTTTKVPPNTLPGACIWRRHQDGHMTLERLPLWLAELTIGCLCHDEDVVSARLIPDRD